MHGQSCEWVLALSSNLSHRLSKRSKATYQITSTTQYKYSRTYLWEGRWFGEAVQAVLSLHDRLISDRLETIHDFRASARRGERGLGELVLPN